MTKKLDETFNIEIFEAEEQQQSLPAEKTPQQLMEDSVEIMNALTNAEKVDNALSSVSGLNIHDKEMDEIATKAIDSYKDLCDLGMNVPDANAARIFEVASTMLKTAMEAKDAKVNRKLRTIELQLKKARLDWEMTGGKKSNGDNDELPGVEFDRNELLQRVIESRKDNDEPEAS